MKKKTIIISIIAIIGIVIAALAVSYALFNINITKNKINKIVMGNLELTINDDNANNTFTNGKIVVNSMVPMKDTTGMQQNGYSFTLTNTGSIDAYYSIYLDDVVVADLPNGITGRLDNSLVRVNLTNTTTSESHTYTLSDIPNRVLEVGTLDTSANKANNYVLRIWLDYSAGNEAQNKYFAVKLRVDSIQNNATYNIVSGDINTVGSVIAIGDQQFYVVSSNAQEIALLAKYNLNVGNYSVAGTTGVQNSACLGATANGSSPYPCIVAFDTNNSNNYSQATIKAYVDDYVNILKRISTKVKSGRLLKQSDLEVLINNGNALGTNGFSFASASNYTGKEWLTDTSYWLDEPLGTESVCKFVIAPAQQVSFGSANVVNYNGVRPLIIIER